MNLIDFFDHGARLDPDRPCYIQDDRVHSYREVRELTLRIAAALRSAGFAPGEAGAVFSANDATAFTCALSMVRAGGVWVSVNPRSAPDEIAYILDHFECRVLFYQGQFEPMIATLRERCPGIRNFICIDQAGAHAPMLHDWISGHAPAELQPPCDPDATVLLASTGGTTGKPKGVMLSHRNMETFIANCLASMPFATPPVYLAAAPLTHAAGCMALAFMAAGGTTVVHTKVDPQEILKAIPQHQVSTLFLPPTAIYVLLSQPNVTDFDYSSLRYFIYGAAPMSAQKLQESMRVFGPVMAQIYGQAEAPMTITFLSPKEHLVKESQLERRLRSCGRPTPFARVAIMDDDGMLLGDNRVGEIVVQGDLVMKGYLKNREATFEASKFGWHHTGDLGYRDEAGYYYIVDRKKDMIISGGFNVYPGEIEQVLSSHPAVLDCAVVGVPDEKWGEAVKAVVQFKPGQEVAAEDLISLCKASLGSVKAPKTVEFVTDLPRSPVGKVLKKEIRAKYWEGQERQVG